MFTLDEKYFCPPPYGEPRPPHGVGHFPPEKPRYTMTEEIEQTAREMRNTIDRLLRFEERLKNQFEDMTKNVTSDNVIFKNTFADAHRTFLEAVKNEVNVFEGNMDASFTLFKTDLETNYATLSEDVRTQVAECLTATEKAVNEAYNTFKTDLNDYKTELNTTYDNFRDAIESRLTQYNSNYEQAFSDYVLSVNQKLAAMETRFNNSYSTFTTAINNTVTEFKTTWANTIDARLDGQDAIINDMKLYFYTNFISVVENKVDELIDSGRMADIVDEAISQDGVITINSQENFNTYFSEMANGGVYRFTCNVVCPQDLEITQPITLFSENGSKITFSEGKLILRAESELIDLKLSGHTYDFATTDGVVNVHAKCKIKGCEIDGLTEITDSVDTSGIGGYGIALFEGADGTEIEDCYIHNVSNSFIENWHNNASNEHPQITDLKIISNTLFDSETGDGIALNGSNILVKNNSLNGKWENGFLIHPKNENGVDCENVTFEGNKIDVTTYQDTKNGYGIAIRQADDGVATSVNCIVRGNIFNGWGNTENGVEGIRVDSTCKNTVIEGNIFPDRNTPSRGACVRDRGENTIIKDNVFNLSKGTYVIHKCGNGGIIKGNIMNITGGCFAFDLSEASAPLTIIDNVINDTHNTAVIIVNTDNVTVKGNRITCSQSGISTNTTAVNTVIEGNTIYAGDTGIILQNVHPHALYNAIIADKDGINISAQCVGATVTGNDIIINVESENARDGIISSGNGATIIHNRIKSAKRNAIMLTSSSQGDYTVDGNTLPEGGNVQIENYLCIATFKDNNFNHSTVAINSTKPLFFCNNKNFEKVHSNNKFIVYDGYLMQRCAPNSGSEYDVTVDNIDLIRNHNVIVEDISVTPYAYYKLMSDNTWREIFTLVEGA